MKPIRLEVRGFTAFREPAAVEFEGRKLFAITGPTGAGKSSLLDAITWALYGQVPRVGRSTGQLLSHGMPSMSVLFEFSVRGKRYRVARRSPGTTSTRLEEALPDGEWRGLADHANEVTREVTRILGLDYQTFTKTILLPQGAFDSFLKGDQAARREIMTKLLGLAVYTEVGRLARARASQAKDIAQTIRHQLEQLHLAAPEQITALEEEHEALTAESARLEQRRQQLADLAEAARSHRDAAGRAAEATQGAEAARQRLCEAEAAQQQAAKGLETARAQLDAMTAERAALGYNLETHRALDRRVGLVARREEAQAARDRACEAVDQAGAAVTEAEHRATTARDALEAATKQASKAAQGLEASRAAVSVAAGRAVRALGELQAAAEAQEAEAVSADSAATEHEERAGRLKALAEQVEALDGELERASAAAKAANHEAAEAARAAEVARAQREAASQTLEGRRVDLDRQRVQDAAATIQRTLQPGDPCPVCGEPVGEVAHHAAPDLDAAGRAVAEAERVLAEARESAEVAAFAAAAAGAREQECQRAVGEAQSKRNGLAAPFAELGVTERGLRKAIATAEAEAAKDRERASKARAEAGRQQAAAQELRLALAALPAGLEPGAPAESEPDASPRALRDAIEAQRDASEAAHAAEQARRDADATAGLASMAVQQARQRAAEAEGAAQRAEATLAERRAEEDGDAAELRAALAAAGGAAKRAAELDAGVSAATADVARAESRSEAAAALMQRANSEAAAAAEAATVAQQTASEALDAFERGWRDTVADGQRASFEGLRTIMQAHRDAEDATRDRRAAVGERLANARTQAEDAQRMRGEAEEQERTGRLASTLAGELQANHFVAYVQQEAMSLLAADASARLAEFTSGRYELAADDDEFQVVDRLNGDERRSVKTLSGGETFLASLALALSLSEHLPQISGTGGSVSLESLFLDEGFGSLDPESLDLAVQGLETLAGGHRMIGVISHVAELAERLPDRIDVVKGATGSTVRG